MFSLARKQPSRVCDYLARRFSQVVPQKGLTAKPLVPAGPKKSADGWSTGVKVLVREDHGLYGFFKRKANAELSGEDAYETVESPRQMASGRAWRTSELRLKSFQDLHTLWYITLRERNRLATQREEARRMGIKIQLLAQVVMTSACRKTMARIKAIMNERRLAYEGALQLAENHKEEAGDRKLLRLQRDAILEAHEKLSAFATKGRFLTRKKTRMLVEGNKVLMADSLARADESSTSTTVEDTEPAEPPIPEPITEAPAPTAKAEPNASATPVTPETPSRPQTAAETVTAGLFGQIRNRK